MKKYFSIIGLLFVIILLTSCSVKIGSGVKPNDNPPVVEEPNITEPVANLKKLSTDREVSNEYQIKSLTAEQKSILQSFSMMWPEAIFTGKKNEIFSPMSLYMALAMLSVGASDEDIVASLEALLGSSSEKVLPLMQDFYQNNHYSNDSGRCYLANSIWVRPELDIEENYYTMLSDYFNAESYLANFASPMAKSKIVEWINYYTEDLLKLTPENYDIDDNLAVMLLNTIYFNNKWSEEFGTPFDKEFKLLDGTTKTTKFMYHKVRTTYKFTTTYTAVSDAFANGNKIYYFMPKDGNFTELFKTSYDELVKGMKSSDVRLTVPLFKTMAEYDLVEPLCDLGFDAIFSQCNGYQGITQNLYIDIIKQNAGIILSEKGVEAAAVTQIGGKVTSAGIETPEVIITLDQPFFYIIVDANNIPLFMGVTTEPKN